MALCCIKCYNWPYLHKEPVYVHYKKVWNVKKSG